jgi:hypothetical protein
LGVFGLVGKIINCRINIGRETLLLTKIYGLEFELKIAF